MDINFGDQGDDLLQDDGDLAFGDNNQLLDDGCGDGCGDGNDYNGIQIEDMEEDLYNNMGDDEIEAINEGKNSYLEMNMNKAASMEAGSGL